jgi:hypothetical protein
MHIEMLKADSKGPKNLQVSTEGKHFTPQPKSAMLRNKNNLGAKPLMTP